MKREEFARGEEKGRKEKACSRGASAWEGGGGARGEEKRPEACWDRGRPARIFKHSLPYKPVRA